MRKIFASIMVGGLLASGFASTALADEELASNMGGPLFDDSSVNRPIGFSFDFYGTGYTSIWIGSNGILAFTSGETDFSPSLGEFESDSSGPAIAPLWTDLSPNVAGSILYVDTVPGEMSVIYTNVPRFGANTALNTFTVTLFSNGHIRYAYGDLLQGTSLEETIVGLTDRSGSPTQLIDLSAQGGTILLPVSGAFSIVGELFDDPLGPADLSNTTIDWVVPAPGALALLGLAGLVSRRRRRA